MDRRTWTALKDSVSVEIDAVIYYKVTSPIVAVCNIKAKLYISIKTQMNLVSFCFWVYWAVRAVNFCSFVKLILLMGVCFEKFSVDCSVCTKKLIQIKVRKL